MHELNPDINPLKTCCECASQQMMFWCCLPKSLEELNLQTCSRQHLDILAQRLLPFAFQATTAPGWWRRLRRWPPARIRS